VPHSTANQLDLDACLEQVDRLIESPLFQSSEAHCRLIRFLADRSLYSPTEPLKEYQIATEGLGRPPGFDPDSDSSVRVQITRLRVRLNEYYNGSGSHDPILVEIPKGRYVLTFKRKPLLAGESVALYSGTEPVSEAAPETTAQSLRVPRRSKTWVVASIMFLAGVLAAASVLAFLSNREKALSRRVPVAQPNSKQTALGVIWTPFITAPEEPVVVFRNLNMIGNSVTGMRRFDPAHDNPSQQIQRYTGVGEVIGIFELYRIFGDFGSHFRLKRDSLFTIDDARQSNVIFVGSTGDALNLVEIPGTTEFTFRRLRRAIIDMHPRPGSASAYARTYEDNSVEVDYAVVALKRGLDASRWSMYLEGTSTFATQAAVEYVSRERSVAALLDRLGVRSASALMPFEGLLRVRIQNDVPLDTELVSLRPTKN